MRLPHRPCSTDVSNGFENPLDDGKVSKATAMVEIYWFDLNRFASALVVQ